MFSCLCILLALLTFHLFTVSKYCKKSLTIPKAVNRGRTDDTTAKREGQKEEGQTIRRPNEKNKKRKDRRYDGQTKRTKRGRTDDTTAKRKGQKEEGQTIRRQSEKDRRYDDKARRTDDTTAKRKGQKEKQWFIKH
jgi:hypothetical protein